MRDTYCSHCGTAYVPPLKYPRRCPKPGCGVEVWSNPLPVAVALVPVVHASGTGLLVVRRGIEPGRGKLALVGGFAESHETWQQAAAREVREEAGAVIDAERIECFWFTSTAPRPDRVLLFGVAASMDAAALPAQPETEEVSERGLVFGPGGLAEVFAFPLHARAAEMYFARAGLTGPHRFTRA